MSYHSPKDNLWDAITNGVEKAKQIGAMAQALDTWARGIEQLGTASLEVLKYQDDSGSYGNSIASWNLLAEAADQMVERLRVEIDNAVVAPH